MSSLIKKNQWFVIGLAAVVLAVAGCSGTEAPSAAGDTSQTAQSSDAASEAEKPDDSGEVTAARVVENVALQPGPDPMAMVLTTRKPNTEAFPEQIRVNYPAPDKAVVTVIKSDLPDDSVAATRTRYEFAPVDGAEGAKQWQLVQVTEQNKCQPGRGAENWTGALCQ